jgi:hypothetical protein
MVDLASILKNKLSSEMTVTPIVQDVVSDEMFSLETLRRSLPYVQKIDIESGDPPYGKEVVIVFYHNGLIANIECFEKPSKVSELINIALAGAHQCLSEIGIRGLFTFDGKERHVWRTGKLKSSKTISSVIQDDKPKLIGAVPYNAPSLREVQLAIPGIACMPGENSMSSGQKKALQIDDPNVAQFERSRITHDRVEKIRLDKPTANRAVNAMAELLRSVGLDETEKK